MELLTYQAIARVLRAIKATSKAEVSRRARVAESNLRYCLEPNWHPSTTILEKLEAAAAEIEAEKAKEAWASGTAESPDPSEERIAS